MTAWMARTAGALVAVAAFAACGVASGGWWLAAAGLGIVATVGAVVDDVSGYVQVLAALALTAGVVSTGSVHLVPVLVAAVVVSIEFGAVADQTSIVRPRVRGLPRVLGVGAFSAALSAAVLVVGDLTTEGGTAVVLVAAIAALVAIRVLAR